jgi:hypothetical protein
MEFVIFNIAIIGAGQLGSRHLQGLVKSSKKLQINVVDPNENSLKVAEKRFYEVSKYTKSKVSYHQNIRELPQNIDLAIIATTANVRRKVVEDLLVQCYLKYIILEKIVFQKSEDFIPIQKLFLDKGVKSWVNCARRSFPFYKKLKIELIGKKLSIKVKGNNWGLACNSIHMIDLLAFLTEQTDFDFDTGGLENIIIHSKRNGFKELKGTLKIETKLGDTLELIDYDRCNNDFEILISNNNVQYNVFEGKGLVKKKKLDLVSNKEKIQVPYQSDLTGTLVDQILETGESDLTSFGESMKYHILMLDAFNEHFSRVTGKDVIICPIT